jgi:hypothetical protein
MRGRFAVVAAAMSAVLVTGCASQVAGSGVRGSDVGNQAGPGSGAGASGSGAGASGSGSGQGSGPGSTGSSVPAVPPSGQSAPIRPIPPIVTTQSQPATGDAGSAGSSSAGPSTSDVGPTDTTPADTTKASDPGGASPIDEFQGATEVDPAQFSGIVTAIGFQSPSGNIHCGIQDGVVVCQLDKFTYTPPAHDCGPSGWGFNFKLAAKSAELFCAGDVEGGGPTLQYGQMIVVQDDRCVSREDGVVCQNTATGYGFRVAKASYVFFGPSDVATTVGASGTGAPASIPAAVLGEWGGHGRSMTIAPDGTGTLTYRTYQFCSDDPTPPCDSVKNDEIVSGGHIEFRLLAAQGSSAATGSVTQSNDPKTPVGTAVTATVSGYNLELSFWPGTMFCAPDTPSGQWNCGA